MRKEKPCATETIVWRDDNAGYLVNPIVLRHVQPRGEVENLLLTSQVSHFRDWPSSHGKTRGHHRGLDHCQ
jgi:hypothetical protein